MSTGDYQPEFGQYGQPGGYPPPYGGQVPGGYPPPYGTQTPGGLGRRFFARVIDGIIVGIVAFFLSFITDSLSNYWVTGLFSGLLMFVYFVGLEVATGATPGKKLLGLAVHGAGNTPKPTAKESAIRNAFTLLPIIPFVGGFLGIIAMIVIAVTISASPTKQGKHDELAGGTQVVRG
ncbi:RDD family protein [Mycolicibacterium neworleansense]|uniref:RDD family protein n=1 Tax=Mycolicibacterium neworleansense TaxID=146018 RepID=A0A0H5RK92_9MYCO|nr:RDD family protein [Mycolicibacterium neworleansense]MCV7360855.1 RDD family protein [Mycolicibacterium neworleansense]CRZ14423.1 RDD family protein [Mycolicibacterium neworleansense]